MNIKIENKDSRFKRLLTSDSTGFYVDASGKLYLAHVRGISSISSTSGGTSTFNYEDLTSSVRKLGPGDVLTIEF